MIKKWLNVLIQFLSCGQESPMAVISNSQYDQRSLSHRSADQLA